MFSLLRFIADSLVVVENRVYSYTGLKIPMTTVFVAVCLIAIIAMWVVGIMHGGSPFLWTCMALGEFVVWACLLAEVRLGHRE